MTKFIITSCFILFGWSQSVYAQSQCQSLFVTAKNYGYFGQNLDALSEQYFSVSRENQLLKGVYSNAGKLSKDIYVSNSFEYATVVSRFTSKNKMVTQSNHFLNQALENIQFVLNSYSTRRDWSEDLRKHLDHEAMLYAEQSTYIEVRKIKDFNLIPDELIGTMKIVKVGPDTKQKKLPLEADFSAEMPTNGGLKFEPSNFVVDKNFNKIGISEIYTQLILHARQQLLNPNHEPNKMMYYTPADQIGVKMYGRLGFTAVPGYEAPIKEGDKNWWMIGATAETIANLPKLFAENKLQWSDEEVLWINKIIRNFQNLKGDKTHVLGYKAHTIKQIKGYTPEIALFKYEPYTLKNKNYYQFEIAPFLGSVDIKSRIIIAEKDFPLQDGWISYQDSVQVSYKDKILKIYDVKRKTNIAIRIDSELKNPEYLRFKGTVREFTALF